MSRPLSLGEIVSSPPEDVLDHTQVGRFVRWLAENRGVHPRDHQELWRWSVDDLEGFWSAIWEFSGVRAHRPAEAVLAGRTMPGARWFPGALLNYADRALGEVLDAGEPGRAMVLGRSQTRDDIDLSAEQLRDQVARAASVMADLGVRRGDRVAAYLPNVPETLVAFLATVSLGAVWSSCATEFGPRSVIDRFAQIEPRLLLVAGGYRYGDQDVDRSAEVAQVRAQLPTVQHVVDIEYGPWRVAGALSWPGLMAAVADPVLRTEPVPFDHPLVILFSSGTTGVPKAIVHGHGGILLEHLKNHTLSWDMGPHDRMLWFSTTAWMMWNALVSSLLVGASVVLLDGNPAWPDLEWQWNLAEQTGATVMGASPGFVMACRKAGVTLQERDLRIRVLGSAGSPLPPEGYGWLHEQLGPQVHLNVGSGGTDVCSGLVQNNPWLPVYAGEISGRCLGVDAHAFDEQGREVIGELGELVITAPMPSMPVGFWGDHDGSRLREAYFERYPGIWRHGDWIVFHQDGRCHVAGRSDATLNRGGVRLGTAEFYRVAEELPEIDDSLVVHLEDPDGGNGRLVMFVVLAPGVPLDDELRRKVVGELRSGLSPRHGPDEILQLPVIPRNLTGKKLELPVKRILCGAPVSAVAQRDALADPTSLDVVAELARTRGVR